MRLGEMNGDLPVIQPTEQFVMLRTIGEPVGIPITEEWNLVARPKKLNDKPVTETDFDSSNNHLNCTEDQCNYIMRLKNRTLPEIGLAKSRMRGHLMVTHGFSAEQIATKGTKANNWLAEAFTIKE